MVSQESKTSSPGSEKTARRRKKSRPLDETALRDLALSYAARFATTAAKLEGYLARKVRERGLAEDADGRVREPDIASIVTRMVELGYVDDDAYARARSRDLTGRGYGKRRVEQALWAAGVDEEMRAAHAPGEAQMRHAAMLLAKRRRFGPFAPHRGEDEDVGDGQQSPEAAQAARKAQEKQVAAMLRAGHVFEHVRFILEAPDSQSVEDWVAEAEDAHVDEDARREESGDGQF